MTAGVSFLPPDTEFLRRDPALPGLVDLLDPRALADRLQRALDGQALESLRITYVKYQPGSFCRTGHQLKASGRRTELCATAYRPGAPWEWQRAHFRSGKPGKLGVGRLLLDELAAVVSFFPNDRKMTALRNVAKRAARQRLLHGLLPSRPDLAMGKVECLAYKPERRYVARLHGSGDAAVVLKFYNRNEYRAARRAAGRFIPWDGLLLPRALGLLDEQAVLAFEWLPGRTVREAVVAPDFRPEVLRDVGAALAQLHAQEPGGLQQLTAVAQEAALCRVAEAFASLYPRRGARARQLGQRLGSLLTNWPSRVRALHGDFNATQVLLAGGRVAFLDFDRAGRGDPALDLGNFLAVLEHDALAGDIPPVRVERAGEALLEGYRAEDDPLLAIRVRGYTAALLLQWLDPFRYWAPSAQGLDVPVCWLPHWPERAEALLDRVEALLSAVQASSQAAPAVGHDRGRAAE
jgi:aminoglycoside phosphotransferase (APT) family kinase protein